MQERIDQRLLDSMKTTILSQIRERVEERFEVARQEIDLQMKTTREATLQHFHVKYSPVLNFLEQLSSHLQNAMNERTCDSAPD